MKQENAWKFVTINTLKLESGTSLELAGVVWRSSWWLRSCGTTTRSSSSFPFVYCDLHKPPSWSRAKIIKGAQEEKKTHIEIQIDHPCNIPCYHDQSPSVKGSDTLSVAF
ncbi:hypothetical protein Taro_041099 [Colocasia esculenta]|uniref:Uncharacterized protein n=1 Tax=Colocasia esculenta TaxID=4460 RepID=A0A843WKN2_COLES|nr:hypothetical protein [Colocasia esculenta]